MREQELIKTQLNGYFMWFIGNDYLYLKKKINRKVFHIRKLLGIKWHLFKERNSISYNYLKRIIYVDVGTVGRRMMYKNIYWRLHMVRRLLIV